MKRRSNIPRWILSVLSVLSIIAVLFVLAWFFRGTIRQLAYDLSRPSLPVAQTYRRTVAPAATSTAVTATPTATRPLPVTRPRTPVAPAATSTDPLAWDKAFPKTVNLAVPFLVQAPNQNWDMPYQEACEEAATIMVDAYYDGKTKPFTPDEGDRAILAAIAFEDQHYGDRPDMTAEQTAGFIRDYFHFTRVLVRPVAGVDDIKSALAHGYPVIIPANGKALGNPNFRNGGPKYHMLVIKGYLADGRWITNDPGTHNGSNYLYDPEVLLSAMHDWNGGDVPNGQRVMLVVLPEM